MPMSVDLGAQLEAYVASLVTSGRYNSKSEVLRAGARIIQERETRLATLDAALARGIAEAQAGLFIPAHQVFVEIEAMFADGEQGKAA